MLPLASVMAQSDAIVTCADLNPTSKNVVGRDSLAHVRPGTLLVNIARGGLVEEAALAEAIRDGRIARGRAGRPRTRAAGSPTMTRWRASRT